MGDAPMIVIDADSHVMEPADLWERYLDPRYRICTKSTRPGSTVPTRRMRATQ